ncbi:hypothetical protein [Sphingopyxis sp. PET50]|uniref:hypothetical protein n=1 Tax=Sphingopyxis sp. PET50 TaxID=2976533 RepID=UPI0028B03498|nr:hypothetical protein [Sphingopyxis sp. PET50]
MKRPVASNSGSAASVIAIRPSGPSARTRCPAKRACRASACSTAKCPSSSGCSSNSSDSDRPSQPGATGGAAAPRRSATSRSWPSHSHDQASGDTAAASVTGGICGWTTGRVRQSLISTAAPPASGTMRTSAWMSLWSSAAISGRLISRCSRCASATSRARLGSASGLSSPEPARV